MASQWHALALWLGAAAAVVVASFFYQPASPLLLVWTNDQLYTMELDTLTLERIGSAATDDLVVQPGCTADDCWVAAGETVYHLNTDTTTTLPRPAARDFVNGSVSASPDGVHLAYGLAAQGQTALHLYDVTTGEATQLAASMDPAVLPAWSRACVVALRHPGCKLAYKPPTRDLMTVDFASDAVHTQVMTSASVIALQWTYDHQLVFQRSDGLWLNAADGRPVHVLPEGAETLALSPNGRYVIYYQPFEWVECEVTATDDCIYEGIWLAGLEAEPRLIYDVKWSESALPLLNTPPVWTPSQQAFVFFFKGRLIHYHIARAEGTIWYETPADALRSDIVFSPGEDALATVDSYRQGYRLLVIDPHLEAIKHIVQMDGGFRVLAWLE